MGRICNLVAIGMSSHPPVCLQTSAKFHSPGFAPISRSNPSNHFVCNCSGHAGLNSGNLASNWASHPGGWCVGGTGGAGSSVCLPPLGAPPFACVVQSGRRVPYQKLVLKSVCRFPDKLSRRSARRVPVSNRRLRNLSVPRPVALGKFLFRITFHWKRTPLPLQDHLALDNSPGVM